MFGFHKAVQKIPADIIADAREYLEEYGWCRGTMRDRQGHVCVMGAICHSQGWVGVTLDGSDQELFAEACRLVLNEARKVHPGRMYVTRYRVPMAIPDWNDRYASGEQEILDVLAKAEKIARAGYDPDAP